MLITLSRLTPKKNGPLKMELRPATASWGNLPAAPDLGAFVMQLYSCEQLLLGDEPPAAAQEVG